MDITVLVNLILALVIFALGIWAYAREKGYVPLYIGIAFLLFAITHLITLLGLAAALSILVIIIRVLAYIIVIGALYRMLVKK